ncbi:C-C motif chemokine 2-like isoform X2 [Alosa sapidissima]|uniref:C-C motif chemokine 2-like isoform X2 n=1 Tax=Alosa sapidissima TaxID=34773 RepID=UPI001C0A3879|nr:C-C motif chemokine 2-like isoform X2 [Alosa sapidissima]
MLIKLLLHIKVDHIRRYIFSLTRMESCLRMICLCIATGLLFATLGRGIPTPCCQETTNTVLRQSNIVGYHRQGGVVCPVEAVVFTTVKGIRVCSSPKKHWVKKALRYIDLKKQQATTQASTVTTEVLSTNGTEPTRNATAMP